MAKNEKIRFPNSWVSLGYFDVNVSGVNRKSIDDYAVLEHKGDIYSSEASSTIWSCYANLNHYHYSFL